MISPNSQNVEVYAVGVKEGETIVATYTGLENSVYNGRKISKVVYSLTNKSGEDAIIEVAADPTNGATISAKGDNPKMDVEIVYYYDNGEQVNFVESAPALFSLSSLNNVSSSVPYHIEKITDYNFRFIGINGSSVTENADGIYSKNNNDSVSSGSEFNNSDWDNVNSPHFYYGAAAGLLTGN